MDRYILRNHAFDRIGDTYAPVIDHDHFLGRSAFDFPRRKRRPPVNLRQEGELYVLEVAVPGFPKESLNLTLDNGILTIRGEKKRKAKGKDADFVVEEFNLDSFERSFKLSSTISREKISAQYKNGILRITFTDVPPEEERDTQEVPIE